MGNDHLARVDTIKFATSAPGELRRTPPNGGNRWINSAIRAALPLQKFITAEIRPLWAALHICLTATTFYWHRVMVWARLKDINKRKISCQHQGASALIGVRFANSYVLEAYPRPRIAREVLYRRIRNIEFYAATPVKWLTKDTPRLSQLKKGACKREFSIIKTKQ